MTTEPNPEAPRRVLVAEDNDTVREFIRRALESVSFEVAVAKDGQEALEILAQQSFDVLVTDIVMPVVDGIAVALKATQLYPALKIVMISGYPQERMRAHNLDTLVHQIIPKPFSLEEICHAVQGALA